MDIHIYNFKVLIFFLKKNKQQIEMLITMNTWKY